MKDLFWRNVLNLHLFSVFWKKKQRFILMIFKFWPKKKKLGNLIIFTFQTLIFLLKAKVRINKAKKKFESSATIAEISSFWGYLSFNNKLDLFKSSKDFFLFFQRFWIFIIVDVSPFVSTKNTYQGKTMESFFFVRRQKLLTRFWAILYKPKTLVRKNNKIAVVQEMRSLATFLFLDQEE